MVNLSEREKLIDLVESHDKFWKEADNESAFVWEKYLISDYWKNWKEKIRSSQTEKDANFLANKVRKLRADILWNVNAYKKGICDAEKLKKVTEISERELQNITRKEWENVENISNELGRFLTGELIWKRKKKNINKEELIREISELKVGVKRLKSLEINSDWEKAEINKFSQKLEQHLTNSQMCLDSFQKNDNKLPIIPFVSIIGVIILLLAFIAYKHKRK